METILQNLEQIDSKKKQYEYCNRIYWKKYVELQQLERLMNQKRAYMENECRHEWERDWEDRDERSRWICKFCGKSR